MEFIAKYNTELDRKMMFRPAMVVDQRAVVPHSFIRHGGNVLLMKRDSRDTGGESKPYSASQSHKLNQLLGSGRGSWNI